MSKYELTRYPQNKYRFRLFDNIQHYKTAEAVLKAHPGAVGAINLWYFALADQPSAGVKYWDHQAAVMICGGWACKPTYGWPGLCIDADGRATVGWDKDATYDYAASVQADYIDGKRTNTTAWGRNGVTYTGFTTDGTMVAMVCSEDSGMTSTEAVQAMLDAGCVTILRWDGSWSSQGQLLPGMTVKPSQNRPVRGWLIIYPRNKKEEDKPVGKRFRVCIDPGHDPKSVNGSPDGSYKEFEFAWDMAQRIKPHLERCGMDVVLTKSREEAKSLTDRVGVSNQAVCDVFLSTHTNAPNSKDLDKDGWCRSIRGLLIFTSAAGESAGRNKLARCILAQMRTAGIAIPASGLLHEMYTVLAKTNAPANIIEYGFHTNREDVALLKTAAYRAKLAEATARGVCDYLGVAWVEEAAAPPVNKPWYAEDQAWVKEMGISDGTRAEDTCTRAEVWAMLRKMKEGT